VVVTRDVYDQELQELLALTGIRILLSPLFWCIGPSLVTRVLGADWFAFWV